MTETIESSVRRTRAKSYYPGGVNFAFSLMKLGVLRKDPLRESTIPFSRRTGRMRRHRPTEAECARKRFRFVYEITMYRVSKTRAAQNEKICVSSNCLNLGICHDFRCDGKIWQPLNPIHRNFVHENGNPRDGAFEKRKPICSLTRNDRAAPSRKAELRAAPSRKAKSRATSAP